MKLKMLVGAAAVAALITTPVMAKTQEKLAKPQQHSTTDQTKKTTKKMTKVHKTQARHARASGAAVEQSGTGFPPLDFATGVVGGAVNTAGAIAGGAVNTAGAIATAPFTPFRGDSYAYYRDTSTRPNRGFIADANGPTCLPGRVITMNGQKMLCQ
jgi:hypothetical protein